MIGFTVNLDVACLHDSVQVHIIAFPVYICPSCLHDSGSVEIVTFPIGICQPSGECLVVHQIHPAAAGGNPDSIRRFGSFFTGRGFL